MINRLVKTESDYKDALTRIEELMDAGDGTAEAEELELLATLVEMYEDHKYPINFPDPVDAIRFRMEQSGLKQQDLTPYMGSRSKVSEVLNRKRPLTLSMIRGLHHGLDIPAEVLLREPEAKLPTPIPGIQWERFPISEMVKRGWLPNVKDIKERAEEYIRDFMEKAGFNNLPQLQLRQGIQGRLNDKTDIYAVFAWCLRLAVLANENPIEISFNKKILIKSTFRDIARLSYFRNGPLLAREYLNKQGIHFFIVPHLPKTYLDGGAMLLPNGKAIIGLTLRYDREDNFWFCLLHELAHLAHHISPERQLIVDEMELGKQKDKGQDSLEAEADQIASDALIPRKYQTGLSSEKSPSRKQVLTIANKLKISPAIIAGRIRFNNNNYQIMKDLVGKGNVRCLFPEYSRQIT